MLTGQNETFFKNMTILSKFSGESIQVFTFMKKGQGPSPPFCHVV